MKRKNKGFTLIEVMVTIAIIAIFTGVVTMLISNGSASYRNTSSNARVQMETQETLDQLQDLVIDANRTIYYGNGTVADLSLIPNDIDGGGLDDASVKTLVVCSASDAISGDSAKEDYVWDVVTWKAEEQKLYYNSYSKKDQPKYQEPILTPSPAEGAPSLEGGASVVSDASTTEAAVPTPEPVSMDGAETVVSQSVFASDIVGFWADIHEVETKGIIRFQIQARKNSKTIKTLHTVNLRNKVRIEKPGDISSLPSSDARIAITNPPAELSDDCGEYWFDYSSINVQAGSIFWTVTGANGTTVNGWGFPDSSYGKMIIQDHADSPGDFITVTVTATSISGKTISDSCKVKIVSTVKAEGLIPNHTPLILGVGNIYDLDDLVTFSVRYSNGKETPVEPTSITWSGNIGMIEISPAGTVSEIPQTLGTDPSNSLYTATATYQLKEGEQDIPLQAEIPIQLARVDLKKPNRSYFVGENKELEYEYKVGGSVVSNQNTTIRVENTDPNSQNPSMNYEADNPFTEKEVGNWKATITVPVNGSEKTVSSSSTFQVEQSSLTAEIVVVDHKTTLLPGEDAEMYLVLKDKNTGAMITEASVSWSGGVTPDKQTNIGSTNPVSFTAHENNTGKKEISASYQLSDNLKNNYTNPSGTVTISIYVSKLFMTITSDRDEFWNEQTGSFKATVRDAETGNSTDVTSKYKIEWSIKPSNDEYFTLKPDTLDTSKAYFEVIKNVTNLTHVTITATAKDNNGNIVCDATYVVTVNPKETISVYYTLNAEKPQILEHKEYPALSPISLEYFCLEKNQNDITSLPENNRTSLLEVSTIPNDNWKITLKSSEQWDQYQYILLVLDYGQAIYHYYIQLQKNNVYDYINNTFVSANKYVPGDTNTIRKTSILSEDGYTYTYNTTTQFKYSINRMTGWAVLGGWFNSSARKWFMKCENKYYRYNSSDQCWYEWKGINTAFTNNIISDYWNGTFILQPQYYWQKWN